MTTVGYDSKSVQYLYYYFIQKRQENISSPMVSYIMTYILSKKFDTNL